MSLLVKTIEEGYHLSEKLLSIIMIYFGQSEELLSTCYLQKKQWQQQK